VFTRDGIEKDSRALAIEKGRARERRKDFDDQLRILEEAIFRVRAALIGQTGQWRSGSSQEGWP
jgi:DNA-directed RNA polymerase subunit beta